MNHAINPLHRTSFVLTIMCDVTHHAA